MRVHTAMLTQKQIDVVVRGLKDMTKRLKGYTSSFEDGSIELAIKYLSQYKEILGRLTNETDVYLTLGIDDDGEE